MIVSENIEATVKAFIPVLNNSVEILKNEAGQESKKYLSAAGVKLEGLVLDALQTSAYGTEFEGSIRLASGIKFPDIVLEAGGLGVEVKSTTKNHWITTGNSVLESTRVPDIKKIFLMFGKLADPIDFKVRPYEECLKEVLVTHYPRYQIDMELQEGQTIFDKMGKSYDEVRQLPEPIAPVIEYYSAKLKPGESLWWTGHHGVSEQSSPITVRELSELDQDEKIDLLASSFVLFPQLFGRGQDKFHEVLMWLLRKGFICGNIRDFYTAGGQWDYRAHGQKIIRLPQVVKRFHSCRGKFMELLFSMDIRELEYAWRVRLSENENRFSVWKALLNDHVSDNKVMESICEMIYVPMRFVSQNLAAGIGHVTYLKNDGQICPLMAAHQSDKGFNPD